MTKKQADVVFEELSAILTQVRQLYRHLRDTGQADEAGRACTRMRRLEAELDELLAVRYERWMGDARKLLPDLHRMAGEAAAAVRAVRKSARNVRAVTQALKILDEAINLAGGIAV